MKVLKITLGAWHNESRDKKELSVAREAGAEVFVMAKGNRGDNFKKDYVDGFLVYRFSTRPLGNQNYLNHINRVISFFIWVFKAREFNADVISGHDLIALFIAWLSNIGRKNKAKLVYDSHEFELGRNDRRSKLRLWFIKQLEGFLIKRSAFSIMVNDSIAEEVSRIYNLKERPIVVRSIPLNWKIDAVKSKEIRQYYLSSFGVSDNCFICMYHGAIMTNRGIEELIEVISKTENTVGVILGDGSQEYILKLKKNISHLNVNKRILFIPAVQLDELVNYIGASDCGIIALQVIYKSYYLALPNKFFENIQSLTPIICNNTPAMADIINHYNIGLTIDPPGSVEATVKAVNKLSTDKELYKKLKLNLIQAKKELTWENEKVILQEAYMRLFERIEQ